jgi:RNA polymerase sigma factor (sigma-70 family)
VHSAPPNRVLPEWGTSLEPPQPSLEALEALIAFLGDCTRCLARNPHHQCFRGWFAECLPRIVTLFQRHGLDRDKAHDCAQEALALMWREAKDFDPSIGPWPAWAMSMIRRVMMAHLRAERRALIVLAHPLAMHRPPAQPIEQMLSAEERTALLAIMRELAAADALLVRLRYANGMTDRELARFTGRPLGTVKARLNRVVRHMRRRLTGGGD